MAHLHVGRNQNKEEIERIEKRAKWMRLLGVVCLLLYIPLIIYLEEVLEWWNSIIEWSGTMAKAIPIPDFDVNLWVIGEGMLGNLLTIAVFIPSMFIQLFFSAIPFSLYMIVILILLLVIPIGTLFFTAISPILVASGFWAFSTPDERHLGVLKSGVEGEEAAMDWASFLPAESHVFSNLYIEDDGHTSETDLIVVTRGGVSVIEVKNYSGILRGDHAAERLARFRRKGEELIGKEECYNPVRQVRTHVHRLAGYLKRRGIETRVSGYVLFTHPELELELTDKTGIYRDTQVFQWYQRYDLSGEIQAGTVLTDSQIARIAVLLEEARVKHDAQ